MASRTIVLKLSRPMRRRLERLSAKTRNKVVFRRCQSVLRLARGEEPAQVAEALSCSSPTVYRNQKAFLEKGERALWPGKSPGRPRKVTEADRRALDKAIAKEPRQLGLNFSNWTAQLLVLYLKWAVHAVTVWRHLWALKWRWRRPGLRVASPDPRYAPKSRYLRRLQRAARRGQIHLYYEDEMDVALLPTVSGRWMRLGQQTKVNTPGVNAKQYVFGATNALSGEMVWLVWPNKNNVGFRELLKALLAQHAQDSVKIVLVLDNFRIHKAKAVQALLGQFRKLMRFYFLPTYSPQLNPIERVWRHFRRNVTDNVFFKTMRRLLKAAESFLTELATKPKIVLSIIVA
jgi:transposase